MSKPGPKPKCRAAKEFYGNAGHRPLNDDEPQGDLLDELPLAPKNLGPAGIAFYEKCGRILLKMGVLTEADVFGLEILAGEWEEYQWAMDILHEDPESRISVSDKGYTQIAAVNVIKNGATKRLKEWFALYCLTPSSRAGKIADGKKAVDPMTALRELMQGGSAKKKRGTG